MVDWLQFFTIFLWLAYFFDASIDKKLDIPHISNSTYEILEKLVRDSAKNLKEKIVIFASLLKVFLIASNVGLQ